MIALLLACATAPTLTVTCTDSAGAEVFRAECPADRVRVMRDGAGYEATCYAPGGFTRFVAQGVVCRALPEAPDAR